MTDSKELKEELGCLKQRIQILEDKESIRDLITQYGFTADLERVEENLSLWTRDCSFKLEYGEFKGTEEIRKGVLGNKLYQSIKNRCQHLILGLTIEVEGDNATAAGYSVTTVHWQAGFAMVRCALNTFRFQRVKGVWRIRERTNLEVGEPGCNSIIPHVR
ncbi:MAG: nuclear transport factor 2 family protein [Dehalococcoidales bacterium]|nr:nuclear transport factor 2 family protein [Dehalococcoidales bacterium]